MSDGTSTLRFLDPKSYAEIGTLEVTYQGKPLANLNELEYVRGRIFANVWQSNSIVVIDPLQWPGHRPDRPARPAQRRRSWCRRRCAQRHRLRRQRDRLFVTGKLWPKMFEIRLKPTALLEKAIAVRLRKRFRGLPAY